MLSIVLGAAGLILMQSYANGPATAGQGATGAPGEGTSTCITCHGGGNFGDVTVGLSVLDAGAAVTEYEPGKVYQIELEISNSAGTPGGFGFQMLSLTDLDDSNVGGWANPSANAKLASSGGRDYVEHDGLSATNTFSVDWTAPAEGTGDITFYTAGNAVNGNGASDGDVPVFFNLAIAEMANDTVDSNTSIFEVKREKISLYPNPTSESFAISSEFNRSQIEIINAHGQQVMSVTAVRNENIDVSALEPGIYFVRIAGTQRMERILKL